MNFIKQYRLKAGITQEELAQSLDVTTQIIKEWENNRRTPTKENLLRLSKVLKVPADKLIGEFIISSDKKDMINFIDQTNIDDKDIVKGAIAKFDCSLFIKVKSPLKGEPKYPVKPVIRKQRLKVFDYATTIIAMMILVMSSLTIVHVSEYSASSTIIVTATLDVCNNNGCYYLVDDIIQGDFSENFIIIPKYNATSAKFRIYLNKKGAIIRLVAID